MLPKANAFASCLIALIVAVAWCGLALGTPPAWAGLGYRKVPKVLGKKINEATKILNQAGFEVEAVAKDTVNPSKHLRVFRQSPRGGSVSSKKPAIVTLHYYDMRKKSLVPPPPTSASPQPPSADTSPGPPRTASPETAPSSAPKTVSPNLVRVPLLLGLSYQAAYDLLLGHKLSMQVGLPQNTRSKALDGLVARQQPFSGTMVKPYSEVQINLFRHRDRIKALPIQKGKLPDPLRKKEKDQKAAGEKEKEAP
ncbi:MAG: PASTA domain-containing protein [Desulfarculaceae bacterium]|jgi:beta-lactam-binding protein with PASTA domain